MAWKLKKSSKKEAMNTSLLSGLIYLLGFIGVAAIGLLSVRSWQVLRVVLRNRPARTLDGVLAALAILITGAALWSDLQITVRIFKCLTEAYCGPGVASGWAYLAMLGAVYIGFEIAFFLLKMHSARREK